MDVGDEFASNAAAFLEASRSRNTQRAQDLAGRMHGDLDRFVRRAVRARTLPGRDGARASEDDVVREVLQRALGSPPPAALAPDAAGAQSAAGVTLLAWLETVAVDYILALRRRARAAAARGAGGDDAGDRASLPVAANYRDHAHAAAEILSIERALAEDYPRGLEVFAMLRADPELGDAEIAEKLGTTAGGVYKIRHRMRAAIAERAAEASRPSRV